MRRIVSITAELVILTFLTNTHALLHATIEDPFIVGDKLELVLVETTRRALHRCTSKLYVNEGKRSVALALILSSLSSRRALLLLRSL